MKKLFGIVILTFLSSASFGQYNLIGTTYRGGENGGGTIFSVSTSGVHETLHDFQSNDGRVPIENHMREGANGLLYGATRNGDNAPVLFEFDPISGDYEVLEYFHNSNPTPLTAPHGQFNLNASYVVTAVSEYYGAFSSGAIYTYDIVSDTRTILVDFDPAMHGGQPSNGMFLASNGKYYGGTQNGGANNYGTFWEYDPITDVFSKLHDYNFTNGRNPKGCLVEVGGFLYGTTLYGGSGGWGTIYKVELATGVYSVIHDFSSYSSVENGLSMGPDGHLYGVAGYGGANVKGYIFRLNVSSNAVTNVFNFSGPDGNSPSTELILDGSTFLGLSKYGGTYDQGVLYEFDPVALTVSTIYEFDEVNGLQPIDKPIFHSNGKYYGFTTGGGKEGSGVIYAYDPNLGTVDVQIDFNHSVLGSKPLGTVVSDGNGKYYCHASNGGVNGSGGLVEFDKNANTLTAIQHFGGAYYDSPYQGLSMSAAGIIYATVVFGGANNTGFIYSYDPNSTTYTQLYDFDLPTGAYPQAAPVEFNGILYGTTTSGGSSSQGVLYAYDLNSGIYTVLEDFTYTTASYAAEELLVVGDKIYGTSQYGGANYSGSLFVYDTTLGIFSVVYDFQSAFNTPSGGLLLASDGNVYGMCLSGGSNSRGGIFSFDLVSNTFAVEHDFDSTQGNSELMGALVEGDPGKLYSASIDSDTYQGIVFEFDIATSTLTVLHQFAGLAGNYPLGGLFIEAGCDDMDNDGICDDNDNCPNTPNADQQDTDGDGLGDVCDVEECDGLDNDGDGVIDEGFDSDGDGTADCFDGCPTDPNKTDPGICGCGLADEDSDNDGTLDCLDNCPTDPLKTEPGDCGCGNPDTDSDGDGTADCNDGCPNDATKTDPGVCGCGLADDDSDGDGTVDCLDNCPTDPLKTEPGDCGCGNPDTDSDGDGTADCNDGCPTDPLKTDPGTCGCGVADEDGDGDLISDCLDNCPTLYNPSQLDFDMDGIGDECDDSDSDGLSDADELAGGTDPLIADTDNDGVSDGDEVLVWSTNPLLQDTDGDGLTDGAEITTTLTNPLEIDTDFDGCNDLDQAIGACGSSCPADLNGDNTISTQDLLILLASFGSTCD
jgi:uncharacterized repeat protein (TIGR03803 family)